MKYRPKRDYDVFTKVEQDALFALPAPDGQLQTILHCAGLRRSEAICLTGKRIDLNRLKIIVIEGAKGGKERTVPMVFDELPVACADLLSLEGINGDEHLWATRPGGRGVVRRRDPISSTTFERWWKRCIDTAGVRYRNPHMARHSFVTRLREARVPIEDIKWMVGHESLATTEDTYSHPNMDELGDRVRKLVGDGV